MWATEMEQWGIIEHFLKRRKRELHVLELKLRRWEDRDRARGERLIGNSKTY